MNTDSFSRINKYRQKQKNFTYFKVIYDDKVMKERQNVFYL